jgi:hypothetical protein
MKKKANLKIQLGAALLGVVATTVLVAGITYAQNDNNISDLKNNFRAKDPGERQFHFQDLDKAAIQEAISSNNYDAWLEAQGDQCPFSDKINHDNFSQFVEMHNLKEAGDREGAQKIAEELGLDNFRPEFRGQSGLGKRKGCMKNQELIKAIDNNDYEAWVAAHDDKINLEFLTEERFAKVVEFRQLMSDEDGENVGKMMKEFSSCACSQKK